MAIKFGRPIECATRRGGKPPLTPLPLPPLPSIWRLGAEFKQRLWRRGVGG